MATRFDVRRGVYHDSVTLMQVSAAISVEPGIVSALVAMATPLNVELLVELGFDVPDDVGPTDLVVAVRGGSDGDLDRAGTVATRLLDERSPVVATATDTPPATVGEAIRHHPETSVVLISVPGTHVLTEAVDALDNGAHVVIFSDNVSLADEVAIKSHAQRCDRFALGPDCGTVVLGGIGLGFSNVVRPGPVSLVAASGTGAQQLCALLDHADVGVSNVIGVGGRDLSAAVGAPSTLAALDCLDADPGTEVIGLVSKSTDPSVIERVMTHAAGLSTPVIAISADVPGDDLTQGAGRLLDQIGAPTVTAATWGDHDRPEPRRGLLRAWYSGGTLAREALDIISDELDGVSSNLHGRPVDLDAGHVVVDLGSDEYTTGRPHPMIDLRLRLDRLAVDAARGDVGVVLLDVVLGHGAHPDPAAELAHPITTLTGRGIPVVITLVGTRGDPQGLDRQAAVLVDAGAHVFASNAAAARHAAHLALGPQR